MPASRPPQRTSALSVVLMIVVALGAWALAGPAALGGFNSYLITSGISMLPNFHTGDFVVARTADSYHVGDIIAYHWEHTLVLHRIVAEDQGHFVMKGDNNGWYDPVEPAPSDVAGKLWIHIPGGGKFLSSVRQPILLFGLLAAAVAALTIWHQDSPARRRGRRRGRPTMSAAEEPLVHPAGVNLDGLAIAAAVLVASLVFVAIAFSRPLTRSAQMTVPFQQVGTYTYSAPATGSIYAGGKVQTGDQVFFSLVRNLDLNFDYWFTTTAPHRLSGTYQLLVDVGTGAGWSRTIELVPQTPFTGDHAAIGGSLDLYALQALMNNFDTETGARNAGFTVSVKPIVHVQGEVAGQPVADALAPNLDFRVDSGEMQLVQPADASAAPGAPAANNPLKPLKSGTVSLARTAANHIALPFLTITVLQARIASLVAVLASLLATAVLGVLFIEARRADEASRLRARFSQILLDVQGAEAVPKGRIVELLRPDDLARIAEREGRMILHSRRGDTDQFMVSDGELVYRYQVHAPKPNAAPLEPEAEPPASEEGTG